MDERIINALSEITSEEKEILEGKGIDRENYMSGKKDVVNSEKLLEMGKLITIRPNPRFTHFPKHSHDFVEVVYMLSGSTTHIINGKNVVLKKGQLLFLGQKAEHEIFLTQKDDIAVNFIILPQFLDISLKMMGQEETPLRRFIVDCLSGEKGGDYLIFKVEDVLTIQNLIENLLFTFVNSTPNKRGINQATMGLLLMHLANHTESISPQNEGQAIVIEVLRYIEENYVSGSLKELSNLMHYDFYWLSREIKRKTGKSYTELVQEKRMSQAAYLLKTTQMNVSDISLAVGYENVSYFHKLFASRFFLSPSRYRNCK